MYSRRIGGQELTFVFNPNLHKNNLLLADLESKSIWSQLEQHAIDGPKSGVSLEMFGTLQTTWGHWRSLHPCTSVLDHGLGEGTRPRYAQFVGDPPDAGAATGEPRPLDEQMILGITHSDTSKAFPFVELVGADSPVTDRLGSMEILLHYRCDVPTAWATDENGSIVPAVITTRKSWLSFHPESAFYRDG